MKLLFLLMLLPYVAWASNCSGVTTSSLKCDGPVGNLCDGPDWYWEKYNGHTIPSEAVDGTDCSDQLVPYGSLFVGQGHLAGSGLLPGSINVGSCELHIYSSGKRIIWENINILCSKRKSNIRWIQIHIDDIPRLEKVPGIVLISGGYEGMINLYIGRQFHHGVRRIGKIYPIEGLSLISSDGQVVGFYHYCEILVYIPSHCNDPVVGYSKPQRICPACPTYPQVM